MSAVQVNDQHGYPLTIIVSGETVGEAKDRLSSEGILETWAGVALRSSDVITVDGAPYVFKRMQSMHQGASPTSAQLGETDLTTSAGDAKRQKTLDLDTLVDSNAIEAVAKELMDVASRFRGTSMVDPKSFRKPDHKLGGTWNESTLKFQIRESREIARGRLAKYQEGDRNPVVVAFRNGSGFGKTHILTEAPGWLNAKGIYVTYNQGQNLKADSEHAAQAILLRLVLVMAGYSPQECAAALTSERAAPFLRLPEIFLRRLFVSRTQDIGDIAICVDEVSKLPLEAAQRSMSALSDLAAFFYQETKGAMCTVLVSSLKSETFRTLSDRSLIPWHAERPNHEALDFFAYLLPEEDKERVKAEANALGGGHMRSLVYCFKLCMEEDIKASMNYLFNRMDQEYGTNIIANDLIAIRNHVVDCIASQTKIEVPSRIEEISDENSAVPPCYILKAFEKNEAAAAILRALFASFCLYNSPGKQLEEVAKQYDLFRAALNSPVVPGLAEVCIPIGFKGDRAWYKSLKFTGALVVNKAALLKQQNKNGSRNREVVATGFRPQLGCYYHPEIGNHPWIDRLFVALHPGDNEECLVVIQDKVISSDFSSACEKLQSAANLLSAAHGIGHVLLIVNVIGATGGTTAQGKLTWPHVLVRGEAEVRRYYSVNFADIVLYARRRHLLSK